MSRLGIALTACMVIAAISIGVYSFSDSTASRAGSLPFARGSAPKPIAELRFQDGAGRPRSLAGFQGKLVLVNIWATGCGPCREEMPALERLHAGLGGPDFEVVALSIDQ
ncbi:MAG: TlpA disulfide reductase family protein [Burkholderiales bacterium]